MKRRMKIRLQRRQIAELLVGVVPSAILFTPVLLLLLMALAIETVPGLMRGRPPIEDWKGLVLLLMGPVGLLALVSLTILIMAGPERVLKDRMLKILVGGSGLPALMFSTAVVVHQVFGPGRGAEDGQALWIVSLGLSTLVGTRYLVHLPELIPPEWVQSALLRMWRLMGRGISLAWSLGRFLLVRAIWLLRGLAQRLLPPLRAWAPQPVGSAAVQNRTPLTTVRPSARPSQTRPSARRPASRSARSRARPSRRKPA